ncbi:hypothetical protein ASG72_02520 [Bosea sp. Leaf344]|uniref:hypothetical protein n=1 Tax=Bosea sp. Leaf344 TaxID=1736346 RepID=UPI0006FA73AC|nr:hypothetical protein [Bosea sp. Leaf344]KQU54530.1 hypothetical protein ASG72_02520 [Bosea sp. Leaf344]
MPSKPSAETSPALVAEWPLPASATLGSSVRLKGIEREVRRRLPWTSRSCATAATGRIVLRVPVTEQDLFDSLSAKIATVLEGVESLPILPSEAEDILSISPRERQKWLKEERLHSAGTRTVKLRGRAKAVTFHVFDPRHIEDVLAEDLPELWREEDRLKAAENRRRAAGKAALKRAAKARGETAAGSAGLSSDGAAVTLEGWEAFDADGLLR